MADLVESIEAWLKDNMDGGELLELMTNADSWDSSFDFVNVYDFEDLAKEMDAYEFGRAIVYGNVTNVTEPVRFNAYANLENVSEYTLEREARERVCDLARWLADTAIESGIDLPPALMEIIERGEE